MRHGTGRSAAAAAAVALGWAGSASAANSTYTLCFTGAGKPLVAPGKPGKCASGQKPLVLASGAALSVLRSQVATLKGRVATLQGQVSSLQSDDSSLKSEVATLQSDDSSLQSATSSLQSTLSGVSRNGNTLLFSGMNLQIESGSGSTDGKINGLGNLIIGYDENPGAQTGSHNLVVGQGQTFTSYGGIIGGSANSATGAEAVVFGRGNTASGEDSAVTGGGRQYCVGHMGVGQRG